MKSKSRSETVGPGRTTRKEIFVLAAVFVLLAPAWHIAPLCAAEAGRAIPGREMGQLTPLEPYPRAPLPPIDKTIPPPPAPLPPMPLMPDDRGAFNPRTGERYPPSGEGVFNPRTGEYYPRSGNGYFNPRTGEYFPPVDQRRP